MGIEAGACSCPPPHFSENCSQIVLCSKLIAGDGARGENVTSGESSTTTNARTEDMLAANTVLNSNADTRFGSFHQHVGE